MTFGSDQHTAAVALLAVAVFLRLVSEAQGALIQGMRRISDLAQMGVLGALFGTTIGIPIVYFLRESGVVPSLVGVATMMFLTSWWYSRKVQIPPSAMASAQVSQELVSLLKLGFAFMASGFLMMGAAYAVRIMVLRQVGFEAAGFYQSAWTLGGLYVGFILQAMAADFYPRLTAVAKDNAVCNRLVNEQAQVSLLLAGPGVIATLTFAPVVIALFYSAQFDAAVGVLRWICLGMTLRVITWPMGFIIMAKGAQYYLFWTDLAWAVVNVGLSWLCVGAFGVNGAGIAFLGSYVFHGLINYPIVRRLSDFRWSTTNRHTASLFLSLIAVVFCGFYLLPPLWATGIGAVAVLLSGGYSIRVPCYKLAHLLPECINSILSQSFRDLEILIMDDCSPDNTADTARSFQDSRVRYIRNDQNLGHLRNYNNGIALARGRYIWLISADDCLRRPYVLERYVQRLDRNHSVGYACCSGVGLQHGKETGLLHYSVYADRYRIVPGHTFLKTLLKSNIVLAASGLVRRECYDRLGVFPLDMKTFLLDFRKPGNIVRKAVRSLRKYGSRGAALHRPNL